MHWTVKVTLFVFLAASITACSGAAGTGVNYPPTHEESIEVMFELLNMETMMDHSIETMMDIQMQSNPTIAPYRHVLEKFLRKYMSWETLKPEFTAMYMESFTKEEVDQLCDFYRTDVGSKTIELQPGLMKKGALLGQKRVEENLDDLRVMLEAEVRRQMGEQPPPQPALESPPAQEQTVPEEGQ